MAKKEDKSSKDLTIHFMPYSEIAKLDSLNRIKKLIGLILEGKIIILQGRLTAEEESKMIETTMTLIGNIRVFKVSRFLHFPEKKTRACLIK